MFRPFPAGGDSLRLKSFRNQVLLASDPVPVLLFLSAVRSGRGQLRVPCHVLRRAGRGHGGDPDPGRGAAVLPGHAEVGRTIRSDLRTRTGLLTRPLLHRYIYCDEIDLCADTVLATLYAAKKYIVPHLARACVNFLETSLSAKNACVLLSQSCLFEEPDLTQRCWEVIDAQAELALRSEGFCDIDAQTLESILRRETLNAKEMVVFEAALSWAEAECQRRDLPPSIDNKRLVLGKAIYLIRIPAMALEDFANGAAQSGVLTLNETNDIFLWFTASRKPELLFCTKPRKGLAPQRCHRFQSCAYRSNQWRYRGRCDSIQFAVDRRVFIAGFGLYGSSCGSAEYSAKMELKRQGVPMAQRVIKFFSDGSSSTFPVWFDYPVQIEPDTFYTASVVLDGNELSYFGQEGMTEVQSGKVTFQFQCSSDSTNGTGVQGGQIPELIFYA
ncbi:BTB/POZ domain-containing protein 3-like isoform X3 [Poeciliopsis prolifica]|uniref:BTB/POZ domain-containing protein 3-like isoform X3 n=1 Tax=Poeciliopsis prolifica TaxID=188132 RepID=UPI0024145F46|nr:BTB/POZ domain-containing protein 3-like isoform X3 [Poeciliopsis prolifica]